VKNPTVMGYWRSVGNSMNDFFYEGFLDELADKGGQDPYDLRLHLLQDNRRLTTLLKAAVELSGGWKRGPFKAPDGSLRARGLAMASPFGSETAAVAEVSIRDGQVRVHEVWQAIDPGSIVNPAIVEAQVNSAVALGVSQVLFEEVAYETASRSPAISTPIRSSRSNRCRACMCGLSRAGRQWAASANRGFRPFPCGGQCGVAPDRAARALDAALPAQVHGLSRAGRHKRLHRSGKGAQGGRWLAIINLRRPPARIETLRDETAAS
jgi:hypothetical protein